MQEEFMAGVDIARGYIPGSIGRIVELHGTYYHKHWGFDLFFEAKVASELAEFLGRYDEKRDGFWNVLIEDGVEGALAIDAIHAESEGAHLRWFIISDASRGRGFGNRLISTAIEFCREKGYGRVFLWTFGGLDAARHLYEKSGFELVEERRGTQWGKEVSEQRFELRL